jgi:hypothetical protein
LFVSLLFLPTLKNAMQAGSKQETYKLPSISISELLIYLQELLAAEQLLNSTHIIGYTGVPQGSY